MTHRAVFLFSMSLMVALSYPAQSPAAKSSSLDANEETHLQFMREEEKLARDVYISLGETYGVDPDLAAPFSQIAISEQRHTDSMVDKLEQYGIDDPSTDDRVGAFTGEDYGYYFTGKYIQLVDLGKISFLDALYVGALIEELDMSDIVNCPVIIQQLKGLTESECGLAYTDEKRLIRSYDNLLEGSEHHLRTYVQHIEVLIGEGNYEAQYLSQQEVDEILGR